MKIIKETIKSKETKYIDVYFVKILYEHGESDIVTTHTYKLKNKTEKEIILFFNKFYEVAQFINNKKCNDKDLPDYIKNDCLEFSGMTIYIERDQYYDGFYEGEGNYATMKIDNIKYYDESGKVFNVTIEE